MVKQYDYSLYYALPHILITGYVHRDIPPENILLDGHYNVRIGSFSRVYVHPSSDITGTWPYMAPEIIKLTVGRRQEPYSIAVDYWSLGWIVYELESMTHKVGWCSDGFVTD
ncbi:Serine/threonine-protein kinase 32A [Termitomyces sp. J132]|nr:Serine/threonine-protein kinase 32A [Termitomyces sp. J132]